MTAESPAGPIVLVGLSGAGKTVVGRLLAQRLDWRFVDLDEEVERLDGRSISHIFQADGEAAFREIEAAATRRAAVDGATVVSTGGGWMSRSELRDSWPGAVRVWLRVDPGSAVRRLARQRSTRPLLAGPDPEAALRGLLDTRMHSYRLAEIAVRTDGLAPEAVVEAILDEMVPAGEGPAAP